MKKLGKSLLKLLSKEDMDKIHHATVKVLEKQNIYTHKEDVCLQLFGSIYMNVTTLLDGK